MDLIKNRERVGQYKECTKSPSGNMELRNARYKARKVFGYSKKVDDWRNNLVW